jgi:hypothetical protein
MHVDTVTQLVRVLKFCELQPLDDAAVFRSTRLSSFEIMRRRELRGPRIPLHNYDLSDRQALRVRNGKVGTAAQILSQSDVDYIRNILEIPPGKASS